MAALTCKDSVRFKAFMPALLRILRGVHAVASRLVKPDQVVITSASDGVHSVGSRHYTHEALDLRVHNFPTQTAVRAFVSALRAELGPAFTVLYEGHGTPNAHIHVQPKKGTTYEGAV